MLTSHSHYLDQKLEECDRDFLLTRNFIVRRDRLLLSALHALRAELRAIVLRVRDPGVALNKINWWHTEWQRLIEQRARHPVTLVLQQRLDEPPPLTDVILLLAQVCTDDRSWQNVAEMVEFARRFSAPFAALEGASAGTQQADKDLQRCWRDIELMAIVSDVAHGSRTGDRSVPVDLLARHQVEQQSRSQGMESHQLTVRDMVEQTRAQIADGYSGCGLNHAHIYREVQMARLDSLGRNPGALGDISSLRRLWAAWRGARFARRGQQT